MSWQNSNPAGSNRSFPSSSSPFDGPAPRSISQSFGVSDEDWNQAREELVNLQWANSRDSKQQPLLEDMQSAYISPPDSHHRFTLYTPEPLLPPPTFSNIDPLHRQDRWHARDYDKINSSEEYHESTFSSPNSLRPRGTARIFNHQDEPSRLGENRSAPRSSSLYPEEQIWHDDGINSHFPEAYAGYDQIRSRGAYGSTYASLTGDDSTSRRSVRPRSSFTSDGRLADGWNEPLNMKSTLHQSLRSSQGEITDHHFHASTVRSPSVSSLSSISKPYQPRSPFPMESPSQHSLYSSIDESEDYRDMNRTETYKTNFPTHEQTYTSRSSSMRGMSDDYHFNTRRHSEGMCLLTSMIICQGSGSQSAEASRSHVVPNQIHSGTPLLFSFRS